MFLLAADIFTDLWNIKRDTVKQKAETIRRNLHQNEKNIRQLEEEKIMFDEISRTAFSFPSNPYQLWVPDRLEHKRAVMKLTFSEQLRYCQNEGRRV